MPATYSRRWSSALPRNWNSWLHCSWVRVSRVIRHRAEATAQVILVEKAVQFAVGGDRLDRHIRRRVPGQGDLVAIDGDIVGLQVTD